LLAMMTFGNVSTFAVQGGESRKSLRRQAKITMKQARTTALAQVPGGRIKSSELERENGKLIYSFDIRMHNKGIKEVQIDAINGAVVEVTDESPANESKERQEERNEGKHP
jgi:uncharacterized membrane protein YkoI